MRLADFIEQNTDSILEEWVEFADKSCAAGAKMDIAALRDHAAEMLDTIVKDLRTPQTDEEQEAKSKGEANVDEGAGDTAAETHGAGRAQSGFTMAEMVSEYRALRASVIRLWTDDSGSLTGDDLEDLMRFNETIDQALAESTERFAEDIDRSREIFVEILGHDLRKPISDVISASEMILQSPKDTKKLVALTETTLRSAQGMHSMIAALLDFTAGRLGSGLAISPEETDLKTEIREIVDDLSAAHPESQIQFSHSGDLTSVVDMDRICQVLTNLIGNAVKYGTERDVIGVSALGEDESVVIRVHNRGEPIPESELAGIFDPFRRLSGREPNQGESTTLGLGLYIVDRIVAAHGGTIDVRSSEAGGTLFSVRLPRQGATDEKKTA